MSLDEDTRDAIVRICQIVQRHEAGDPVATDALGEASALALDVLDYLGVEYE